MVKRGLRAVGLGARKLAARSLDWVWPNRCVACDQNVAPIAANLADRFCERCVDTFVAGTESCCPICGLVWLDEPHPEGLQACAPCLIARPRFARARGAFAYGGALQVALQRWKNGRVDAIGPVLGALLVDRLHAMQNAPWPAATVVVPIPSPRRSVFKRGFNPAGVLARAISRHTTLPLKLALTLRRAVPKTRGMNRTQRRRRIRGVFRARPHAVSDRPVLLVDDVMTTGATVDAAAAQLRRAGAASVDVVTLARVAW